MAYELTTQQRRKKKSDIAYPASEAETVGTSLQAGGAGKRKIENEGLNNKYKLGSGPRIQVTLVRVLHQERLTRLGRFSLPMPIIAARLAVRA